MVEQVQRSLETLTRLSGHSALLGESIVSEARETLQQVTQRIGRKELSVVIVGVEQSGKSTFLAALIGDGALGAILERSQAVTTLRHRPQPSYRARFAAGHVDDFAKRVPDRGQELGELCDTTERSLAEAEARFAYARSDLAECQRAVSQAEVLVRQASETLEDARGEVSRSASARTELERDVAQAQTSLAGLQQAVPTSLCVKPPWWAVWQWLVYALFVLLHRDLYQRYRALEEAKAETEQRLLTATTTGSDANEAFAKAEAELSELEQSLTKKRRAQSAAELALEAARSARDDVQREFEAVRRELSTSHESRLRRFFGDLSSLVEQKQGSELLELEVDYPTRWIRADVAIIDAPSLKSSDARGADYAWNVIRDRTDGCILLSELDRAVGAKTKQFLHRVREVVPHILLVLTKVDQAFDEAVRRGGEDPWEQVEQARRIGTRRFAREIGRDPSAVLSIAVAAEAALKDDGGEASDLATRFGDEVQKLFDLLRRERALILGARSADAMRQCIASMQEAEARAERLYEERIQKLEAGRLPEPEAFRQQQLGAAETSIQRAAQNAVERACGVVRDGFELLGNYSAERVLRCTKRHELEALAERLEVELAEAVAKVQNEVGLELESFIDQAVREIESEIFEELRRRYQLLHAVRRETDSMPRLDILSLGTDPTLPVSNSVEQATLSFGRWKTGIGLGGAALGAGIGSFILPGVGTLAGAAVGGLLWFSRPQSSLRKQVLALVDVELKQRERALLAAVEGLLPQATNAIRDSVDRSLQRVITRFARWLMEPIEAERAAIEKERANLADLLALEEQLRRHDARLEKLMTEASAESVGLCR